MLSKVFTKGPLFFFYFCFILCFVSCLFNFIYSMFSFCFVFVLVVSGKLKFYWPSSSHRITVTGTSPLPIHPLPCPSTSQLPSITCY